MECEQRNHLNETARFRDDQAVVRTIQVEIEAYFLCSARSARLRHLDQWCQGIPECRQVQ